ncbi:MAG TPA: hypothetical protein VN260_10205, partial [Dissulfurispiraceae bacterium]|nr:hypothetical protein [Dissulfurispiraceae bacterium]
MNRTIKLLRLIILRTIREERFLTVLSIVGVALGIGLFTGVKVASDRAMNAFETEIRGVNQAATHEILSLSGIDFNETLYPLVLQKAGACFPVMKATGYVRARDETIEISGIDTVKSLRFIGATPRKATDIETFYRNQNAVLITASFAAAASVRRGDTLQVLVYDREYSLLVAD